MDDPTRRCENDTDNGTRLSGPLFPSKGPIFLPVGQPFLTVLFFCLRRRP